MRRIRRWVPGSRRLGGWAVKAVGRLLSLGDTVAAAFFCPVPRERGSGWSAGFGYASGMRLPEAPYKRFRCWQACDALAVHVFRTTRSWPPEERYGLAAQARSAAFSATANIAEGSARKGTREFRRFLNISLGSLSELEYTLDLAARLGFIGSEEHEELRQVHASASRLTWALYRALRAGSG